jgi:hypothetical protein
MTDILKIVIPGFIALGSILIVLFVVAMIRTLWGRVIIDRFKDIEFGDFLPAESNPPPGWTRVELTKEQYKELQKTGVLKLPQFDVSLFKENRVE